MFNGIINFTGKITKIIKYKKDFIISVNSKMKFSKNELGSSVCCSGACLTVNNVNRNTVSFYVSKETLDKTNFKHLKAGDIINLEKSMKHGQRISGHFVQGHVDTACRVQKIISQGKSKYIDISLDKKYKKYVIKKGSITLNGISLTISKLLNNGFQVVIIPWTYKCTNLRNLKKRDLVNVEFDVLSKYISNFLRYKWNFQK